MGKLYQSLYYIIQGQIQEHGIYIMSMVCLWPVAFDNILNDRKPHTFACRDESVKAANIEGIQSESVYCRVPEGPFFGEPVNKG